MKAARIHRFGPPEVIVIDDVPRPEPAAGEVLVRVASAGVGPWDALIREGRSAVTVRPPFTLGSDLAGIVEATGSGITQFKPGDAVFGVTNSDFIGASAEFALTSVGMIARKPDSLSFPQAASVPVVAVTAWQMLFDYANAQSGQSVLVLGAKGNVGGYAMQLAARAGLRVLAPARANETDFESAFEPVDIVLDTVGGETAKRSLAIVKPGGILVSIVSPELPQADLSRNVRTVFFLAQVTTERLNRIAALFDQGELRPNVGALLPLDAARRAHEMLAGAPHPPGKIVLKAADD